MFGGCVNCSLFVSLRLRGSSQSGVDGQEAWFLQARSRYPHDHVPCCVCERGLYARPPVKGVLPHISSGSVLSCLPFRSSHVSDVSSHNSIGSVLSSLALR